MFTNKRTPPLAAEGGWDSQSRAYISKSQHSCELAGRKATPRSPQKLDVFIVAATPEEDDDAAKKEAKKPFKKIYEVTGEWPMFGRYLR